MGQVGKLHPPMATEARKAPAGLAEAGTRTYSIGEAADILGISIQSLRLYERLGLIVPLRRSSRHRRYTELDIERVRCLRRALDRTQVTLDSIVTLFSRLRCWEIMGCAAEKRENCPAFHNPGAPCWISSGKDWACRSEKCHDCPVYRSIGNAPVLRASVL